MRLMTLCENINVFSEVPAEEFHEILQRSMQARGRIANNVHLYSPQEYASMKTFLNQDKNSGYALRNGELVSVFSAIRNAGDEIVRSAVSNGATHLDCFDGYLPKLYTRHGFEETRREANWTPGGPDVVFMRRR